MMYYQAPPADALLRIAVKLHYLGKNPDLHFITNLLHQFIFERRLRVEIISPIVMGLLIIELTLLEKLEDQTFSIKDARGIVRHIKRGANFFARYMQKVPKLLAIKADSPDQAHYQNIMNKLNITTEQNALSDDERILYLSACYYYFTRGDLVNKQQMELFVLLMNKSYRILLARQKNIIERIFAGAPLPDMLEQKLLTISADYEEKLHSRFFAPDPNRRIQCDFLNFIRETTKIYDDLQQIYLDPVVIYKAAFMHIAMEIQAARRQRWVGSDGCLNNLCLQALRIKCLDEILLKDRILWLTILLTHLENLYAHHQDRIAAWGMHDYIPKVIKRIARRATCLIEEQHYDHIASPRFTAATRSATEAGLSFGLVSLGKDLWLPSAGGTLIDGAAATLGMVVFGPSGAIMAMKLSQLGRTVLLASAFYHVIHKIASVIGDTTADAVTLSFNTTLTGLKDLIGFYCCLSASDQKDLIKTDRMLHALLSIPEAFSEKLLGHEEKAILTYTRRCPSLGGS